MKINCFPKILFGIYILMFCKFSYAFDETVAAKYNDIFTQNILSQEDITNYRFAYNFQEACKWKSANKHILKIKDKTLMGHILAQRYLHPCLLYTSPSPRDVEESRMPSSA